MGLDLEAIKAREAAASKGPWVKAVRAEIDGERMPDGSGGMSYTGFDEYDRNYGVVTKEDWESDYEPESLAKPWSERDAEFIAHAREDIPALVNEVERLRYIVAALTEKR